MDSKHVETLKSAPLFARDVAVEAAGLDLAPGQLRGGDGAENAEQYDITIEEMEVSPDHVHIFCSFSPRYSIKQVVTRFKSLSARAIFREFPRVKRRLRGGQLWEDSYFARTVRDKVTAEVICRYIQQHRLEKSGDSQLSLFEKVLSLKARRLRR